MFQRNLDMHLTDLELTEILKVYLNRVDNLKIEL